MVDLFADDGRNAFFVSTKQDRPLQAVMEFNVFDQIVVVMNEPIPFWLSLLFYYLGGWIFYHLGKSKQKRISSKQQLIHRPNKQRYKQ